VSAGGEAPAEDDICTQVVVVVAALSVAWGDRTSHDPDYRRGVGYVFDSMTYVICTYFVQIGVNTGFAGLGAFAVALPTEIPTTVVDKDTNS
jgi:hypothetical protein